MEHKLFIPIILGTVRKERQSAKVADYLVRKLKERDIETKLFDVRDFNFPQDGYGQDIKDLFPEYKESITRADGLIIVAPEYNHGYPGDLKKVLDLLYTEYHHKAVGLCGVSAGIFGGVRVIEQLVGVVRELGLVPLLRDVNISQVGKIFDKDGSLIDKSLDQRIASFLDELIWMSKTLRLGRERIKV